MTTLSELLAEHTTMDGETADHLQRVVGTYLIERINAFDDAGDLLMRGADRFPADPEFPRLATIAYENAADWESMQNAAQLWRRRDPLSASSSDLAIAESAARLGQAARADTLVAEYLDEALADPGDTSSLRVLWLWARLRINAGDTATVEDRLAGLIRDEVYEAPHGDPMELFAHVYADPGTMFDDQKAMLQRELAAAADHTGQEG